MALELTSQFLKIATERNFKATPIAEAFGHPLLMLEKVNGDGLPAISISAGIHGDEPAPVSTLLNLLESNFFTTAANWEVFPILNPSGLECNTRENADGVDLNRDFLNAKSIEAKATIKAYTDSQFPHLSLSLHEDWESSGFYLYALHEQRAKDAGRHVLDRVSKVGPIESEPSIDGHPAKEGLILPLQFIDESALSDGWPEAIFLYRRSHHLHMTLESPSSLPLETRIQMHETAITAAIEFFFEQCATE